jgi:RNA polymerase sigma-70 factor, ECF subfamily
LQGDVPDLPSPDGVIAALYDAHADGVWKSLHRLGVRAADVPDLLQEVFFVLHRRRDELDPSRPIEPLLWGIALGLARNYRRRAFRRLEVAGDTDAGPAASDPEADLIAARQRRSAERALDELEPEKRAVFVMFELEGLSGQAIASALGVPVGTVHSRLHAARAALTAAVREPPARLQKIGRRA